MKLTKLVLVCLCVSLPFVVIATAKETEQPTGKKRVPLFALRGTVATAVNNEVETVEAAPVTVDKEDTQIGILRRAAVRPPPPRRKSASPRRDHRGCHPNDHYCRGHPG